MSPRLFLIILLLAHTVAHAGLQFGKPQWGFDGAISKNTFNLLSLEVSNSSASAFDGEITLDDSGSFSSPYKVHVFLAPGSARWVQFFPYIGGHIPDWRLIWDEEKRPASATLNPGGEQPREGPPAVVILASADDPTLRSTRMPVFDEALFPPTVAATDALHAVILDHQPKLDPARREAFLDWLRRGGTVHLLPGSDGAFPQFTGDFAPLNITADNARVGAGMVAKHATARSEITPQTLAGAGHPLPTLRTGDSNSWNREDSSFFATLAGLTRPNIAWPLIYLLTIIYVALIGPAFYFLRKRDYRLILTGFILTVAGFAWIFTVVGRRGYGEKQIYHSVGIARSLGGGRYDIEHWVHAFATSGDSYRLAHPGGGQLYTVLSNNSETIRASVLHGKDAAVLADIPLFSSRPFIHRGAMTGPDPGLAIEKIERPPQASGNSSSVLTRLVLRVGPAFPPNVMNSAVEFRGSYYPLRREGDLLVAATSSATNLHAALGVGTGEEEGHHYYGRTSTPAEALAQLRGMAGILASRVSPLGTNVERRKSARPPSSDSIRVFIYAEAPAAFRMQSDQFQAGTEYLLYVHDIPLPNS